MLIIILIYFFLNDILFIFNNSKRKIEIEKCSLDYI